MHYKIGELEIKSENAAKPISQASRAVLEWIAAQEPVDCALDYGCGKLRYAGALAAKCRKLTLVDSQEQLSRLQRIGEDYTTVKEYSASKWPHSRTLTVQEFDEDPILYQLALCANVLPVIPHEQVRSKTLRVLARSLEATGCCLFVSQYRDTYFTKAASSEKATPHLDGYILRNKRGNSYYGLLPKSKVETLVTAHGFDVQESWVHDKSAYVVAKPVSGI